MYGFVVRPLSFKQAVEPVDALINYCDAHYVSWDLGETKFIEKFKTLYPSWASRPESISEILIGDLEEAIKRNAQPVALLEKLIKLTIDSRIFDNTELEVEFEDLGELDP